MGKPRLLFCGDSPLAVTGFGRVNRYLLDTLKDYFEITMIGVNHFVTYYDQIKYPYRIHTCMFDDDPHGFNITRQILMNEKFDVVMIHDDLSVIFKHFKTINEVKKKYPDIKWITYSPIDNIMDLSIIGVPFMSADLKVTYSKFGQKQLGIYFKDKVEQIYLPVDFSEFYRLSEKDRKQIKREIFSEVKNVKDDTFIIGNVGRNQWRKDIARSMFIFKKFKNQLPNKNVFYFIHAKPTDMGGDLALQAMGCGLSGEDVCFPPDNLHTSQMVSQTKLNGIYNTFDLTISTAQGGGFEYIMAESFMTKVPVLVPNNTCHPEIIGENEERGYLTPSGETDTEYAWAYGTDNMRRPVVNVDKMVKKLRYIYDHYDEAKAKTEGAYQFAKDNFEKSIIQEKWINLLKENKII